MTSLRDSERRHRLALDAARLGAWEHDLLTDEISEDGRTRAIYGIRGEVRGIGAVLDVVHPADRARLRAAFAAAVRSPEGSGAFHRRVPPRPSRRAGAMNRGERPRRVRGRWWQAPPGADHRHEPGGDRPRSCRARPAGVRGQVPSHVRTGRRRHRARRHRRPVVARERPAVRDRGPRTERTHRVARSGPHAPGRRRRGAGPHRGTRCGWTKQLRAREAVLPR